MTSTEPIIYVSTVDTVRCARVYVVPTPSTELYSMAGEHQHSFRVRRLIGDWQLLPDGVWSLHTVTVSGKFLHGSIETEMTLEREYPITGPIPDAILELARTHKPAPGPAGEGLRGEARLKAAYLGDLPASTLRTLAEGARAQAKLVEAIQDPAARPRTREIAAHLHMAAAHLSNTATLAEDADENEAERAGLGGSVGDDEDGAGG